MAYLFFFLLVPFPASLKSQTHSIETPGNPPQIRRPTTPIRPSALLLRPSDAPPVRFGPHLHARPHLLRHLSPTAAVLSRPAPLLRPTHARPLLSERHRTATKPPPPDLCLPPIRATRSTPPPLHSSSDQIRAPPDHEAPPDRSRPPLRALRPDRSAAAIGNAPPPSIATRSTPQHRTHASRSARQRHLWTFLLPSDPSSAVHLRAIRAFPSIADRDTSFGRPSASSDRPHLSAPLGSVEPIPATYVTPLQIHLVHCLQA